MNTLEVVVTVSADGVPLSFSPLCLTFDVETGIEQYELFGVTKPKDAGSSYGIIPTVDAFTTITAFLARNIFAPVSYRFQHQSDAGVPIQSGGLCLLLGSRIDSGPLTNVLAHAGVATVLNGLVCGLSNLACPTSEADGLTVTFTAPDSGQTIITWDWDFGDGQTETTTVPTAVHTYAMAGTYAVGVRENISGGGSVAVGGCPITVAGELTIACPSAEIIGLSVDFTGTPPSAPVVVTNYHWDFGDGDSADTGMLLVVHHDYATGGVYDVVLTATTEAGPISSGLCPILIVSCPDALIDGLHVDLTAAVFAGIVNYHWAFGDGSEEDTGTTNTASHVYAAPGTYDVVVTVTTDTDTGSSGACPVEVEDLPCTGGRLLIRELWEHSLLGCTDLLIRELWES